jgi:beta-mannosidase
MTVQNYPIDWEVAAVAGADIAPQQFIPAHVPGAVQLDWAQAHNMPLPEYAGNTPDYRWMEDSFWVYRAMLDYPAPGAGERAFFVCGGVDYQFQVRVEGRLVYEHEGMFTPFEIPLTGAPGSRIEILVSPAPKSHPAGDDRFQANRSVKPAVSYGWDFHPRLIPLGIWQDVHIEVRPVCHLRDVEAFYSLNESLDEALLEVAVELSEVGDAELRWLVLDPQGRRIAAQNLQPKSPLLRLACPVEKPRLWWPNGQGEQPLYTSRVELLSRSGELLDWRETRVGFRRIRLVKNPQPTDADGFPRGPMIAPITFEVNGRRIFAKGSNWVSPDIFPGRIDVETYRPLLQLARDANLNILRCWGGAIVQKEAFFELCDELGLMIWQEFPLSCNNYEGAEYLKALDAESRAIIRNLRGHACLALWCGGNELFNEWSGGGMTEQDAAMRLLNRNTFELDPERPYMNTSPLYGIGHGYYGFCLPDGAELYQYLPQRHFAAYAEFGVPGPAPADLLRKIIPADEWFPPRPSPAWIARHAYGAWDGSKGSWLEYEFIQRYFGVVKDLEELVECGQLIQAEGLRFFFEEARRQKPACSLAMNWCLNEPWPTAANSSLIAWPAQPKPALEAVRQACRPVLASARPGKLRWQPGETFSADLFLLNDTPQPLPSGSMEAFLRADGHETSLLRWDFPAAQASTNLSGPQIRLELPNMPARRFELLLRAAEHAEWNSLYTFLLG